MINIEKLAEFIQSQLNANTEGLIYKTFNIHQEMDRRYEGTTNFIPSIINSPNGTYLPKNDIRGERITFTVQILLPTKQIPDWNSSVNDFIWRINGKTFYINDAYGNGEFLYKQNYAYYKVSNNALVIPASGSVLKTIKVLCSVPNFGTIGPENMDVQQEVAGYLPIDKTIEYIDVQLPISLKTINDFTIGDEVNVSLAIANSDIWVASNATEYNAQPASDRFTWGNVIATSSQLLDFVNSNFFKSTQYAVARAFNAVGVGFYARNPSHPNYLSFYRIKQTDFTIKSGRVPLVEQAFNYNLAESAIIQGDTKYICTAYYEKNSLLHDLVADMITGSNFNRIYMLKIELIDRILYARVILYDTSVVFPSDEFSVIPLVFTKAMEL